MTTAAVLIPWRSIGCPHREAAWARVEAQWLGYGWPLVVADDGGAPFSRGASVNLAATQVDVDVFVIADADTLIPRAQIEQAIGEAARAPGLVVAFDRYHYLHQRGTRRVLAGEDPLPGRRHCQWFFEAGVSSCVAVSAETWRTVGGFDPRFRSWGHEDAALEAACSTLAGPTHRVHGSVFHLYHPVEKDRPERNRQVVAEYIAATGQHTAMRCLIDRTRQEA